MESSTGKDSDLNPQVNLKLSHKPKTKSLVLEIHENPWIQGFFLNSVIGDWFHKTTPYQAC